MWERGVDRRRIQTAVIGDEYSDLPVVLPLEAIEVDEFRHRHRGATFWCGVLLGGCGGQLTTKLYLTRACHFAHFPEPGGPPTTCRRTSTGISSADHLYIKQGLTRWLAGYGLNITARVPAGGTGTMQLRVAATGADWWVHLPSAARTRDRPSAGTPPLRTLLSEDHPAQDQLATHGFVHRIRCEASGTDRQVRVGTQVTATGPVEWFDLTECTVDDDGLVTPTLARLRPAAARHAAVVAQAPPPPEELGLGEDAEEARQVVEALRESRRSADPARAEALADQAFQLCLKFSGSARTLLRTEVVQTRAWLRGLDPQDRRTGAFNALKRLTAQGTVQELREGLMAVMRLTPKTRTREERDILHNARARLSYVQPPTAAPAAATPPVPPPPAPDTPQPTSSAAAASEPPTRSDWTPGPTDLLERLRSARAAGDRNAVQALCELAEPDGVPAAGRALRVEVASQRAWLVPPSDRTRRRQEALTALRSLLGGLAATGYDLDRDALAVLVGQLADLGRQAGALAEYEQTAIRTWTRRLSDLPAAAENEPDHSPPAPAGAAGMGPAPIGQPPSSTVEPADGPEQQAATRADALARVVRAHLEGLAADRGSTTVSRMRTAITPALPRLADADLVDLLVLVDRTTPAGEPLLANLLTVGAHHPHPVLRRVLARLGRDVPVDEAELRTGWAVDVLRLHQVWRHRR